MRTLAAILGPGLIAMVGDNDAGAFSTYTQAWQNYGTALLWTLLLSHSRPIREPGNGGAPPGYRERRSRQPAFVARATDRELRSLRHAWGMPPLESPAPPWLTLSTRLWMVVPRGYLVVAAVLMTCKVAQVGPGG
jgi:hypothetical protein